jgi:hypothetical protein
VSVRDRAGRAREDTVVPRLHALAPQLDGEPDPAFRAATRARLVAMAAVRSPAPAAVPVWKRLTTRTEGIAPARRRSRLTAGLAGAAMAVTALATLVAVSTDARPGDALYGLKRGTEQTQLALAGDARGQTLLDLARIRLDELGELTGSDVSALPAAGAPTSRAPVVLAADAEPGLVLDTLATMDAQTTEGAAWLADRAVDAGDDAPLDRLAAWSEDQAAGLAGLRAALPASTVDELDGSLALLSDIGTRIVGLEDVLGCASGPPIESTDALGPVPGLCLDGSPPVTGGEEQPGTGPVPGPGPGGAATTGGSTATPGGGGAERTDGSGDGSDDGSDEGSGERSGEGPALPSAEVPGGGGPSLPVPTIPVPTIPVPSLGVPGLPGSSTAGGSPGPTGSTPGLPPIEVCLGPIVLGDCSA